jgi:hypothetical protein
MHSAACQLSRTAGLKPRSASQSRGDSKPPNALGRLKASRWVLNWQYRANPLIQVDAGCLEFSSGTKLVIVVNQLLESGPVLKRMIEDRVRDFVRKEIGT